MLTLAGVGGAMAGQSVAQSAPRLKFSVELASDDGFYQAPALNVTAARFFGPAPDNPLSFVDIDGDTLVPGSSTAYRRLRNEQSALALHLFHPLSPRLHLTGRLSLALGHSRYYLPDGAGILADPITISFAHSTLGAEIGLAYDLIPKTRRTRIGAGFGGQYAYIHTAITSALLDVQNISPHQDGYVYLSADLRLTGNKKPGPEVILKARLKYYRMSGPVLQAGISLGF